MKKAKGTEQVPDRPLDENERAELERLREENRRLRFSLINLVSGKLPYGM